MVRVWTLPLVLVLSGTIVGTGLALRGSPRTASVVVPAFLLLAVVHSPLVFPRSVAAPEAQRRSAVDGRPIVYWRPGCTFCMRLRLRLGRSSRQLHWVDIWRDPAGAEVVRAANNGDETVPTVFVAGRPHVNPDPAWVREQLGASPR